MKDEIRSVRKKQSRVKHGRCEVPSRGVMVILCQHRAPINHGCPAVFPTPSATATAASTSLLLPPFFCSKSLRYHQSLCRFIFNNTRYTFFQSSCLPRKLPARPPRRRRPRLMLPTAVCLSDPEPQQHRVTSPVASPVSRTSADSIHIDMIKDAIVNVSRSPPALGLL